MKVLRALPIVEAIRESVCEVSRILGTARIKPRSQNQLVKQAHHYNLEQTDVVEDTSAAQIARGSPPLPLEHMLPVAGRRIMPSACQVLVACRY